MNNLNRLLIIIIFVAFVCRNYVVWCQLLDCNFDQQNFCRWTNALNGVEDDFDWRIDNSAPIDGFHSIPRTVTGTGFFAFAQGRFRITETEAARAWLVSPVINGLSTPATLNFVFWKTAAPPILQACVRDSGDSRLRCFDTISGLGEPKWVQRTVTIPSNSLPFQIVFLALSFRTALDLIGIDDVTVRYGNGEALGRLIDGAGNVPAAYPQQFQGPLPPGQPYPGPLPPGGGSVLYPQPFPGAQGPSPSGPLYQVVPGSNSPFPGQYTPGFYATPGIQPPVIPTRFPQQTVFPPPVPSQIREIQTPYARTQEAYIFITQPPYINTQQPFYVSSFPQFSIPQPRPFIPSPNPAFPQTERNILPNPVPVVPPPPPVEPSPLRVVPPPPPIEPNQILVAPQPPVEPNPLPPFERNSIGPNPVYVNVIPPTEATTPLYRHTTGEERATPHNREENILERTTHDRRFYMTTSAPEHRQPQESTPRLAVRVDVAETASGQCSAVACPFNKDFCKWYNDLSSNFDWKLKYAPVPYQGAGYIFVTGDFRKIEQRASIKSPSFVVSADSVLEFLAFVSDADLGRLSVYVDDSSNPANLLWKATGHKSLGGSGWRRIRVPLPASSFPTTLALIADQLTLGQFVGLDDVRLTDKAGFDIGCASDSAFPENTISPRIQSIQPVPPLAPLEPSVAKISEAPIIQSAVFAKSKPPFIFVDPTTKPRHESETRTAPTRITAVPSGTVTRASVPALENNDESLENLNQVENSDNRLPVAINNRVTSDQVVDYGWGTIRVNDFRTTLFPRKKYRKWINNTESVERENVLKFKDDQDDNYSNLLQSVTSAPAVKKATTPADPLGVKEFVLQISKDLREMFGRPTNRLNLNNLYNNYPIF